MCYVDIDRHLTFRRLAMKPVERGEVLGLADYETIRERFRARVIEEKKLRRVKLGDKASIVFENHDTVLLQIQEMLRTERITREAAIMHEIQTYNDLIPADGELSATALVEIEEKGEREEFLAAAAGLDKSFFIVVDGERSQGKHDERRFDPERTTAVHYLKFPVGERAARALRDLFAKRRTAVAIEIGVEHPRYTARAAASPELVLSLAEDLA